MRLGHMRNILNFLRENDKVMILKAEINLESLARVEDSSA